MKHQPSREFVLRCNEGNFGRTHENLFKNEDENITFMPFNLIVGPICDMIKRNESYVGHVVFEILAKTVFKFLCFILFLALTNSS